MVKKIGKCLVSLLSLCLFIEANSASCILTYEPKSPEGLERFKKM